MEEIKTLLETQKSVFEDFKKDNDERLKALEKAGSTDPLLIEKIDKQNDAISTLEKQLEDLWKKANRPHHGEGGLSQEVEEHKKAFMNFVRKGEEDGLADLQQKALNVGTDADGGYAIPEALDRSILQLMKNDAPMRQVCNVVSVGGSDYKRLVDIAGATSGWVGETTARTATDTPQLAEITPYMGEIYANPGATQRMLEDAFFDAEGWLSEAVAQEFAEKEGTAFVSGDGTNKPRGILNYTSVTTADGSRTFGQLQHILAASATAIDPDELLDVIYSAKAKHRANATWMFNANVCKTIRQLKDSDGRYLWQPSVQAGEPATLLGYRHLENEDLADPAIDAVPIMFGNFKRGYTIVDRIGIRVLRDPYTNKPYVQFYSTKRVGGMLVDSEAIKLLKMAAA